MAVTSIWRVKGWLGKVIGYAKNPEKTGLADVIAYAADEDKTSDRDDLLQYVSGINCGTATARMEMLSVKKRFGKEDGVTAYHGYQSFAPGEGPPNIVHEIGVRLAEELWGDRFQVLVATHLDRENHLHNHFVINTVSFIDGKKYHRTRQDYLRLQQVSDKLCLEYGLSVIEHPERGRGKSYGEWRAQTEQKPTYAGMMKADIDWAVSKARTESQFYHLLREKGYRFKFGKDLTLRAPGRERGLKLVRNFGENYTLEAIRIRILQKDEKPVKSGFPDKEKKQVPKNLRAYPGKRPKRKISGLKGLYLHYCYLLGILPKKQSLQPEQVNVMLREELIRLYTIIEETKLLCRFRIDTAEQLIQFRDKLEQKQEGLNGKKRQLQRKYRTIHTPEEAVQVKEEIKELNRRTKEIRKELKLCRGIEERSGFMKEKLQLMNQEHGRERVVKKYEYIRRGS